MAAERLLIIGLDGYDATRRVLTLLIGDRDATLALPRDSPVSIDEMQEELRSHGFIVRAVSCSTTNLRRLRVPTVAALRDGRWVVVRSHSSRAIVVDGESGAAEIPDAALDAHFAGQALEITPGLGLPASLWRVLLRVLASDARLLATILSITLAVQILSVVPPQLTRLAVDRALPHGAGSLLNLIAVGIILAGAFQAWAGWVRQTAILFLRVRIQVLVERGFLDHVLRIRYAVLGGRTVGDCMQAMYGLGEARAIVGDRAIAVFLDGTTSVFYLGAMVLSMPQLSVAITLAAVFAAIVAAVSGQAQSQLQRREVDAQIAQRSFVIEALSGVSTIKALGAEAITLHKFVALLRNLLALSLRRQRLALSTEMTLEATRHIAMVLVSVWGGYLALRGRVSLGSFVAFLQLSSGYLYSVIGFTRTAVSMVVLRPELAKTLELARQPSQRRRSVQPSLSVPIAVDDVWFRYSVDRPWVLSGYHLRVELGERKLIEGPSGSGKSTLLRLLAGLDTPERGSVRVFGYDPTATRGLVFLLPQLVRLYGASIYENLRVLSGYALQDRIISAAEASGLAQFVSTLTMGYDTVLPQGATTLSGGQRQLVGITAAMASNRRILLLDEPFANLDRPSRHRLLNSPWLANRTIVYVSHEADSAPLVAV